MPKQFLVRDIESGAEVRAEFTDSEWALLISFADAADRLETAEVFTKQRELRFSAGAEDESIVPPDIEVHQLLHLMRPIILQDERRNVLKVAKLMGRRLVHPEAVALVKRLRNLYNFDPRKENWHLSRDGIVLNSDDFVRIWLNSLEYHWDDARRAEFDDLHGAPMTKSTLAAVLFVLFRKARVAFTIAKLIRTIDTGGETRHGLVFTPANNNSRLTSG